MHLKKNNNNKEERKKEKRKKPTRDYGNTILTTAALQLHFTSYYIRCQRETERGNLSKSAKWTFIIVKIKITSKITFFRYHLSAIIHF